MSFDIGGLPPAADPKGPPRPTVGRRLYNSLQKTRGRQPLRYQFEVVPLSVGNLPEGIENVSLVWERGTKIQYTEPAVVDTKYGTAIFKEVLCQSATVYREGNRFLPKEFVFKLQVVRTSVGQEHRKTVAKVKVDLSAFCTNTTTPQQQQLAWDLKPYGRLVLSLTTTWLHNITADDDQRTDGSFLTAMSGPSYDLLQREGMDFPELDFTTPFSDRTPQRRHRRNLSTGGLPSGGDLSATPPSASQGSPSPPTLTKSPANDFEFSVGDTVKNLWGEDIKVLSKTESAPVGGAHKRSQSVGARPRPAGSLQAESPTAPWFNNALKDTERHDDQGDQDTSFKMKNKEPSKEPKLPPSLADGKPRSANGGYSLKAVHQSDDAEAEVRKSSVHSNLRVDPVVSPKSREQAAKELMAHLSPTTPAMQSEFVSQVQQTVTTTATTVGDMFRSMMRRTGLSVPRSTAVMLDNITEETDINRLKRLARTLLLERDEFQSKLMQNEQLAGNLQLELDTLRQENNMLSERVATADASIAQLRDSALLRTLVDTKVQLAQSDLELNELRGALCKERGRVRQLAARLTSTQTKLDQLANQHPAHEEQLSALRRDLYPSLSV